MQVYYEHEDPVVIDAARKESLKQMSPSEYYRVVDYQYADTLDICEIECGYTYKLVVTGETRGSVWSDYSAVDEGMNPTGKTFLDWYEEWLISVFKKDS